MKSVFERKPLIYLITDGALTADNFSGKSRQTLKIIESAAEAKIPLVQIREKRLSAKLVFELAREAALVTKNSATKLLINDRFDVALAAGADGVHLTGNSLSARIVRRHSPSDLIIGASAHSLAGAARRKDEGADFVTFSPVFDSPHKGEPVGLGALRAVCARLAPFPVIALGGIDETNYPDVLTIAAGFAAIRFLNDAENLRKISGHLICEKTPERSREKENQRLNN